MIVYLLSDSGVVSELVYTPVLGYSISLYIVIHVITHYLNWSISVYVVMYTANIVY